MPQPAARSTWPRTWAATTELRWSSHHGAGVRTIFYGLSDIDIKAGQQVKQGQTLATCGKTTVVEMRIGTVPIDPIAVWRGQCNGLKYY